VPADAARLVAVVSPESAQLELRQQLLTERFGPVAALVLERVLTAAARRQCATAVRHRQPSMSGPAGRVTSSRVAPTG